MDSKYIRSSFQLCLTGKCLTDFDGSVELVASLLLGFWWAVNKSPSRRIPFTRSTDLLGWVMAGERLVFACDCNLIQELWKHGFQSATFLSFHSETLQFLLWWQHLHKTLFPQSSSCKGFSLLASVFWVATTIYFKPTKLGVNWWKIQ